MTLLLLSVLLPFRDAEGTLEEALRSVLVDREVPLEVLAIDDGSIDGSRAIAERVGGEDDRVRLLDGGGRGVAKASALGLEHARGDFIARMDADDVSLEGRFSKQISALHEDQSLAAIGARVEPFPREVVGEGLLRYVDWQSSLLTPEDHAREIFVEAPLCQPSVTIRREALDRVGGYREMPWPEDYDLWLRFHAAGYGLTKLPEVLLRWRHSPGRMTFHHPSCERRALERARAHFLAPRLASEPRRKVVWGAGKTGRRLARELEAEGVSLDRFLDIDPRKLGGVARGRPIERPETLSRERDFVVVALGVRGARAIVRRRLEGLGFVETQDFVCAS